MSIENEDVIRRIVREELKSLLGSMAKTAEKKNGYDTGQLEGAALYAIKNVVEEEEERLPHAWDCPKRKRSWENNCSCGVEKGKPSCSSCGEVVSEGDKPHHWKYCLGE